MKFGSLFSGIGGFDLGFERAGMKCAWQCEIDPKASAVLARHWPGGPNIGDVRNVRRDNVETVDVICGGFPCQDVSLAGARAGLEGNRSTLWSEFYRVICEIRPRWVVIENVYGLLSSDNGRFFARILRELSTGGYDAEWGVISASDVGAPHIRERLWIIAYPCGKLGTLRFFNRDFSEIINGNKHSQEWGKNWHQFEVASRPYEILRHWEIEFSQSPLVRVDDGFPNVVDRLRMVGNALVPQIAERIGKRIVELDPVLYPSQLINADQPVVSQIVEAS